MGASETIILVILQIYKNNQIGKYQIKICIILRGCKNLFGEGPNGVHTPRKFRAWFRRVKQNSVNIARLGEIRRDWAS
jgi:hypothetical protein